MPAIRRARTPTLSPVLFRSRDTRASPALVQLAHADPDAGLPRLAGKLYLEDTRELLAGGKFRNKAAAAAGAIAVLVSAKLPRGGQKWKKVRTEVFHVLAPVANASWVSAGILSEVIRPSFQELLEAMVQYPAAAAGAQRAFDHAVGRGLEAAAVTLLFSFPGAGVPVVDAWHVQTAAARCVDVLVLLAAAVWRGARHDHFVGVVDVAIESTFSHSRQADLMRIVKEWTLNGDDMTELKRASTWMGSAASHKNLVAEAGTRAGGTALSPGPWAASSPADGSA